MAGALTTKVCRFFGYPYAIPNIRGLVRTAFTNNNFGTAFRAFGSPQTYTASEQIVDMLAGRIGMDPSSSAISTSPGKGIPAPRPSLTGNIPCGR